MRGNRATWVGAGLFAAWALHDLEELMTAPANSRELAARAPAWLPIPDDVRREGFSAEHFRTGVGIMAVLMAAAAADGARTKGRSPFFQLILDGFGLHGLGHLASAALARRYTFGVATAPVIVIPYWLWARRELARDGVRLEPVSPKAALALPSVLIGVHALTRALRGGRL
jgi:hypothetical protein